MEANRRIQQLSEVQDPKKVKVLVLADQKASSADFYLFIRFKGIVKLDLSVNKLSSFPAGFTFKSFPSMRTLFLHRNKFNTIKSVQIVAECPTLQYVTLFDNQLQNTKTRHYFVNQLPSLKLMDTKIVKIEERNPQIMINVVKQQNTQELTFPLAITAYGKGTTYFLSVVITQLRMIRQRYLKANPIIQIQRFFRKILRNKKKIVVKQQKIEDKRLTKYQKSNQIKQRLISQRLQIYQHIKTNEQKILSLFLMNYNCIKLLKEKAHKKIFASKSFCLQNKISYEVLQNKLYCLRVPASKKLEVKKSFFPLIVYSNLMYIIRKKGSQQCNKANKMLCQIIKKRKNRQPSYYNKFKKYKVSTKQSLNKKLQLIHTKYEDQIVQVKQNLETKQEILKNVYYKCVRNQQIFPFLFQQLLERVTAAVSIQRMWRGYKIRKHKINSLKLVLQDYSAWLIQRFIRKLGLVNRSKMFIQFVDYAKKQCNNSKQLIISMKNVYQIQADWDRLRKSINFSFPDQRLIFGIDHLNQQIFLTKGLSAPFPNYMRDCVDIQIKEQQQVPNETLNPLDILFKGAKTIKYYSKLKQQIQNSISKIVSSSPSNSNVNSSKITLLNKSSRITNLQLNKRNQKLKSKQKTMKNIQQKGIQMLTNYAIIQYKSIKEANNRKFVFALLTYQFSTRSFIKSINTVHNETIKNSIYNINQRVNEAIILATNSKSQAYNTIKNAYNWQQKQIKLKLFVNQFDYTQKALILYPLEIHVQQNKMVIINQSFKSQLNYNLISYRLKRETSKLTNHNEDSNSIFKPSNDLIEPTGKNYTYKQFQTNFNRKYKSRYQNQIENNQVHDTQNNIVPKFQKYNIQDTQHNQNLLYASQRSLARLKLRSTDRSESNLKEQICQNKKKQIQDLKKSHKLRIQQNEYFRRQELAKIRQKAYDEQQSNRKSLQQNKIQYALSNMRKHNNVRVALKRKSEQDQKFEASFLSKGSYSIKKQLYKFQNERNNSKTKDNHSPNYSSIRSLAIDNKQRNSISMVQSQNKTLNLKTQIKEFSIKGSEYDNDLSSLAMISRQHQLNTKNSEDQFEQYDRFISRKNQKKIQKLKKSRESVGKNKPVHSVFTQQFYPIAEKDKMGFQLPKINRK